jgi:PAS domain S-box-containing protein
MQVPPSVGLSVVAALVSISVAAFAWRRRPTPGSRPVAAFSVGTAVWTGGNALQAATTTVYNKLFWVDVQYLGITLVPLAWFAFACEYTDREEWADRRTLALLAGPFALLVVLAWTNDYHHLVRTSSEVVTVRGNAVLRRTFGPAFWLGWIYSNAVTGVGTILLLRKVIRSQRIYRRQAFAVLGGTTVPWVASGLFYNGLTSLEPEVFFSVSGVAFAYAIAQYDLLDVRPIGRNVVIEEMDDGVLVLDHEDRIVDTNPAASRVFGWSDVESVIGRPITDVVPGTEQFYDPNVGRASDALTMAVGDGTRRCFDVRRSPLSDEAGATAGTAVILRDVTERKRQEARLERQNERLEEVGSTIAHDLRNPLSVANGHLELARETGTDSASEHLEKIDAAHDRMEDIIDEVLDMARGEEPAADGRVPLREVAESAWENVETGDGHLAFEGAEVGLVADDRRLTSLFENLFRNSIDHGGPGVTVRVGVLDGRAGFYVEDDGPGVPEDVRERVFERGFTTAEEGTGVGLAVVSDVAETHDWDVAATENEAGGARFEVRGVELAEVAPASG